MQPSPGEQATLLRWISSLWPSQLAGLQGHALQADSAPPPQQAVVFNGVTPGTPQRAALVGADASIISFFLMPENYLK